MAHGLRQPQRTDVIAPARNKDADVITQFRLSPFAPMQMHMLINPPPTSNAERQRQFQARNPGYDRRRKATQRAMEKRVSEAFPAQWTALLAAAEAQAPAVPAAMTLPIPEYRLALPAPVVSPIMLELELLHARVAARKREALAPVLRGPASSASSDKR